MSTKLGTVELRGTEQLLKKVLELSQIENFYL